MAVQALILAAGRGSRLGQNSSDVPKPLLEVGRRPLIEHMLDLLSEAGVGPVGMVVGYCADEIKEIVGIRAEYIHNPRWATTNSIYSYSLARQWISGPVIILNCDLLLDPGIIDRLLENGEDSLAYDSSSGGAREQMAVELRNGVLADMSKQLERDLIAGENVGVLYLSQKTAEALLNKADELVASGNEKDWLGSAVRQIARTQRIRGVDINGFPWTEIDFATDLEKARKKVWPAIAGPRRKRAAQLRTARWVAMMVILLALSPLIVKGLFPPSSPDWDTMTLTGGTKVDMSLGDRSQRWWRIGDENEMVSTDVVGPDTVRVETRLILGARPDVAVSYLLEIRLDGEPHDWVKLTARPSKSAWYENQIVGKKERIEIDIPDGSHRVSVVLSAGNGHRGLIRLRQLDPNNE